MILVGIVHLRLVFYAFVPCPCKRQPRCPHDILWCHSVPGPSRAPERYRVVNQTGVVNQRFREFYFKISGPREVPSRFLSGSSFSLAKQRARPQLGDCRKSLRRRRKKETAGRTLSRRFLLTRLERLFRSRSRSSPRGTLFVTILSF